MKTRLSREACFWLVYPRDEVETLLRGQTLNGAMPVMAAVDLIEEAFVFRMV